MMTLGHQLVSQFTTFVLGAKKKLHHADLAFPGAARGGVMVHHVEACTSRGVAPAWCVVPGAPLDTS